MQSPESVQPSAAVHCAPARKLHAVAVPVHISGCGVPPDPPVLPPPVLVPPVLVPPLEPPPLPAGPDPPPEPPCGEPPALLQPPPVAPSEFASPAAPPEVVSPPEPSPESPRSDEERSSVLAQAQARRRVASATAGRRTIMPTVFRVARVVKRWPRRARRSSAMKKLAFDFLPQSDEVERVETFHAPGCRLIELRAGWTLLPGAAVLGLAI